MTSRINRAAGLAAGLTLAVAAIALAHGDETHSAAPPESFRAGASVRLSAVAGGGPQGVAFLAQRGTKLTGWLSIWGLVPGSRHGAHVHGPDAACRPASRRTTAHLVDLPDLVADDTGVATAQISLTVNAAAVATRTYVMVHARPGATKGANPGIACGDIVLARLRGTR